MTENKIDSHGAYSIVQFYIQTRFKLPAIKKFASEQNQTQFRVLENSASKNSFSATINYPTKPSSATLPSSQFLKSSGDV